MLTKRLRFLREENDWTQEDVSAKLGISRSTYTNYENGRRDIDNDTLLKLANLYGVTTDYLLGNSDHRKMNASEFQAARSKSFDEMIDDLENDRYAKDDGSLLTEAEKELFRATINTLRKR